MLHCAVFPSLPPLWENSINVTTLSYHKGKCVFPDVLCVLIRDAWKFGMRKKKFCRNSFAQTLRISIFLRCVTSFLSTFSKTKSKIVVWSLFGIVPMRFSLLNDHHRKDVHRRALLRNSRNTESPFPAVVVRRFAETTIDPSRTKKRSTRLFSS